jgi:hypothetical protein
MPPHISITYMLPDIRSYKIKIYFYNKQVLLAGLVGYHLLLRNFGPYYNIWEYVLL